MTQAEDRRAAMIQAGLNLIQQSLSIFDRDLRLVVWNRRYQEMFDLPDTLAAAGVPFEETIRYLVRRGEYGPVEDVEAAVRIRVEAAGPSCRITWSAAARMAGGFRLRGRPCRRAVG